MGIFGTNKKDNVEEKEKESQDEDEDEDVYSLDVRCRNCSVSNSYDIPVGTTVYDFVLLKKCDECGCNVIQPKNKQLLEEEN